MVVAPLGLKHCATAVVFKVTVVLLSQARQYSTVVAQRLKQALRTCKIDHNHSTRN